MASSESFDHIRQWLIDWLFVERDIRAGPTTDLQDGEIELDSLDKTEILLAAEERYAIDLGYENIPREVWRNPSTIARMIRDALD